MGLSSGRDGSALYRQAARPFFHRYCLPHPDPPPLRRGGDQRSPSPVRAFLRTGEGGVGVRPSHRLSSRPRRLSPRPSPRSVWSRPIPRTSRSAATSRAWWRGSTSSWARGSRRGMPCPTLDDRHLRAALALDQGRLGRAEARVRGDARRYARATPVRRARPEPLAISAEELSRHRHAVETMAARLREARAAVTVADAEVRTVETEIEHRTVRAPIAGEVLQVKLRAGEFALAGHNAAPLIVLGAVHPLHLRVDVDEHEARSSRIVRRAGVLINCARPRASSDARSRWPTIATAAGSWIFSMGSRRSARSTRRRPSWREASAPSPRISSDCTRR